jgi:hypothetical protein
VPLGYFANFLVSQAEYHKRREAEEEFWKAWRRGEFRNELIDEADVRYIVGKKGSAGISTNFAASPLEVFSNSEFALFEVIQSGAEGGR